MAFQIKSFASIAASMINWMKANQSTVTDFNDGSVVRTMLEASATEIDELYQQMFNGLTEAIPTATYQSFNFSLLPAVPASGNVTVTIAAQSSDVLISAGTGFSIVGGATTYTSSADVTILAGSTTATILVTASSAGALGNIASNQAFTMTPSPPGFGSATNLAPFTNGSDLETEAQRQARFQAYIAALARGTISAIEYGLVSQTIIYTAGVQTEKVATASIIEPYVTDNTQPVGLIDAYIHNGVGGTSSALVTLGQQVVNGYYDSSGNPVPGWKAAGVVCNVIAATEVTVTMTGTMTVAAGYDKPTLITEAQQALSAYTLGLPIGASFILAEATALVMGLTGITNIVWTAPTADIASTNSQKLVPGTITIS